MIARTCCTHPRPWYNSVMQNPIPVVTPGWRKPAVLVAMCASVFVVNVSTMIINIALPTLVIELDASTRDLLWIVDAFNLAFAALVLAAGSLSDRFGRKLFLLLGLTVFLIASFAGAWSQSPAILIGWRALAGVAAAVVYPVTLSILSNVFTVRRERVIAISIWGAATGLSVAAGPVVGGALVETFWWGSILVFNGVAAAIALILGLIFVQNSKDPSTPPLDILGLALSTLALGALVYTIIEAPDHGWSSRSTIIGFVFAAAVLALFIVHEVRVEHPMLDVRLFTNLRFTAASGSVTSAFFALFGFIFLVTQYFQSVRGYGALETGTRMLPVAGSIAVASLIGPRLAVAIGSKIVVAAGLVSMSIAFGWSATVGASTSYAQVVGAMVFLGLGIGLTSTPATEAIMGVVAPEKAGMGSAVNDATREIGGTLGVAVIGSIALSVYRDGLIGAPLPDQMMDPARDSIGAATEVAQRVSQTLGDAGVRAADQLTDLARTAFIDGFNTGCAVASVVAALAALLTLIFLPAHPGSGRVDDQAHDEALPVTTAPRI